MSSCRTTGAFFVEGGCWFFTVNLEDRRSRMLTRDYLRHVHYCYFNPVKHGLVANVEDWPFSTFHRDMTTGFLPTDWEAIDGAFGERGETGTAPFRRRAD